jgi:hypothetical protein
LIKVRAGAITMPHELTSKDQFNKLLKDAVEVRVVRDEETAKVKIRTKRRLYTFKTTGEEADVLLKGVKVPVVKF